MTITVVIFSLIAGLLVGLLGAVLFIVFSVGVALIFILRVLFFTTAAAVFVWLWGVGTYYIIKWFNEKEIPGIHTDVAGGLAKASGMSDLPGMSNGETLGQDSNDGNKKPSKNGTHENEKKPEKAKRPHHGDGEGKAKKSEGGGSKEDGEGHGTSSGAQHHSDGQENSSAAHSRKSAHETNGTNEGSDGVAEKTAGQAGGVKKKVPA